MPSRDFAEVRKRATRRTNTVPLCLAGELEDQHEQLERQLLEIKPPTSLGDASPKQHILEQMQAIAEQMREATVDFRLRALPGREWTVFWGDKPERGEKETAKEFEPRLFVFYAELVSRSCFEPEMTADDVGELADLLHGGAWMRLVTACIRLNAGEIDVPNFAAASDLTRDSEQT